MRGWDRSQSRSIIIIVRCCSVETTQDRVGEALALHNTARAERSRGHLTEARSQLEEALKIIESLRTKVASQELRSSYFASERHRYDFYIDLLMQMHKQRPVRRNSC